MDENPQARVGDPRPSPGPGGSTCLGAAEPAHHNYRAHSGARELQVLKHMHLEPVSAKREAAMRIPHTATKSSSPQTEKARTDRQQTPRTARNKC